MDTSRHLDESRKRASRYLFQVDSLRLHGIRALLARLTASPPAWVFGLLRTVAAVLPLPGWRYLRVAPPSPEANAVLRWLQRWLGDIPIPVWRPGWVLVTRDEDVREVLSHDKEFVVPWHLDVQLLNDGRLPGTPFILGLDRVGGQAQLYRKGLKEVMGAFRREDVGLVVAPRAAEYAASVVARAGTRPLDAIQDLFVDVFIDTCEQYLGVAVPAHVQHAEFYQWTVAVSGLLFGPPFERDRALRTAEAGADRLAYLIDLAIEDALQNTPPRPAGPETRVMTRLARRHLADPRDMSWETMRSIMMGMVTGSVPTNAIAAGHILELLLSWPEAMELAYTAAAGGDDEQLSRCLFEVMRFRPLNPGPWRRCGKKPYVLARGTWRERKIRPGTYLLASTQSAMFDPRSVARPQRLDPARDEADSLLFGHALHWCAGKYIAQAQITQAFKALLSQGAIRRAAGADGQLQCLGLFPEHLFVVRAP